MIKANLQLEPPLMRADRLLSLMLLLQSKKGMTAQELAEKLEVSERTIYRDIEALSFAGIPIYTHPGVSGGVFLDEDYRVSLASLSTSEAQALAVASRSQPLTDLGMEKAAAGVIFKLLAALPAAQRDAAERLQNRIYIDPDGWFHTSEPVPFLPVLHQAIWEDRAIELAYLRPEGDRSRRRLNPFALVAKANVWYLIGQQVDGEMRTFRVSRILDVTLTEARFQRPPGFDLTAYWRTQTREFEKSVIEDERPCEVVVRVHPEAVRSLISDLTGQFQHLEQTDPQGWVRLRITFYSAQAAETRVLSFSHGIEALEPAWFRARIRELAQQILEVYEPRKFYWKGR
jgi:predicted DNA-binding transcriptional regulator YafY